MPDLETWRRAALAFEGIAGYLGSAMTLTGAGEAERLRGALVTSDFFRVMRVRPAGFDFPSAGVWAPLQFPPEVATRSERGLTVVARLRAGAAREVAQPALRASPTARDGASMHEALREGGRAGEGSARRSRLRSALVVSEIALSLVLLAGATLLARSLAVLYRDDPGALAAPLRREVAALDPGLAVFNVATMAEVLARSVWQPRLYTLLLGAFAAAAVVLAAVGLYGVIAYTVTQRTHEMGVRVALGAMPRDVLRLVVGGAASLALVGIAIGSAGALAIARLLRGMLFGVSAHDPATFIGVPLLLVAVTLAASWLPARRAARVDASVALRAK